MGDNVFISGIFVVKRITHTLSKYIILKHTFDTHEHVDLKKTKFSNAKRYLGFILENVSNIKTDIVTDLCIKTTKEQVPNNYVTVDFTADTWENTFSKFKICIKYEKPSYYVKGLKDIIWLSKNSKPPLGYTEAGQIANFRLYFKSEFISSTSKFSKVHEERSNSLISSETPIFKFKQDLNYVNTIHGVPFVFKNIYRELTNKLSRDENSDLKHLERIEKLAEMKIDFDLENYVINRPSI